MDTPSASTDDFASDVEYDFAFPDQQLSGFFPELGPTDFLSSNVFVGEYSSPDPNVDPSFTIKTEDSTYSVGASRTMHSGTHDELNEPAQGASMTSSSISVDSQAETEQQHSDDGAGEGQDGTFQSVEGGHTSPETPIHNPQDPTSLQSGAAQHSLSRYTPIVHSNPETPRLQSTSSFDFNSPMLARTYSQQLVNSSGHLGRPVSRSISHSNEYTKAVGVSSLHESPGQPFPQLPMPSSVPRIQGGGTQPIYPASRGVLGSSPAAMAAELSSLDRRQTPDYNYRYGQNSTNSGYADFPQLDPIGHPTRHLHLSLDPMSHNNRPSYGTQSRVDYGSHNHPSYPQHAYNFSRDQVYQTNSMSGTDDRGTASPYISHTARTYNPQQSQLPGVNLTEQDPLKFETDENPYPVKPTIYANLEEARRANIPDGAPGPILDDPTIPETDTDKQKIVVEVMDALNDMSQAQDNEGMRSTWKGFLGNQGQLEYVAWQILERCILRHRQKGSLTTNSKPNHHYENFAKRMTEILHGLRTQKTMCKHLMVSPYIDSLIDNPGYAASRIVNNRKVNLGKKVVTERARALLGQKPQGKGRRTLDVNEANEEDADYDDDDAASGAFDGLDSDSNRLTPVDRRARTRPSPAKTSRKRKATSEDVFDASFPAPTKKAKRAFRRSQSVYRAEGGLAFNTSAVPSQHPYGTDIPVPSQQGLGQGHSGGFMDRQSDEDPYGGGTSAQANPSQGQLEAPAKAILQQLLQARQTDDLLNPGNLLDEGTFVQRGKIVRHDPATGAYQVLYEDCLQSPQYSPFAHFIPPLNPYAPTMNSHVHGAGFGTRSTARPRRAAGRTTDQSTQPAHQPPYGYEAMASADGPASRPQKAPGSRKRSRR